MTAAALIILVLLLLMACKRIQLLFIHLRIRICSKILCWIWLNVTVLSYGYLWGFGFLASERGSSEYQWSPMFGYMEVQRKELGELIMFDFTDSQNCSEPEREFGLMPFV